MSEERPGPVAPTQETPPRPVRARVAGFGPLIRLHFRPETPLTEDLFTAISAANSDLRMERTARGDLEIMVPAGGEGSHKNAKLTFHLVSWGEHQGRGLGVVFDSSGGFVLPDGAIRSPDAAWVAQPRWEALSREERTKSPPLCPDFVVELRSHTDRLSDVRKKMQEYLAQGVRLGWLIDPLKGVVEVYRPGREVERLERPATLSGEGVLPGFVLDLKGILDD